MRTELERCEGEVRKLELKLEQARDLLSTETSQRKKAEQERDMMGQKWDMVREFISQSGDTMNDETRTRLQRLEASFASRQRRRHILTRGRTSSLASPRGFDLLHSGQSQQCECCQRRLQ